MGKNKEYSKSGVLLREPKYLEWLREQPCCLQGTEGINCFGDVVPAHGKPYGRGMKGPDSEAIPLCFKHHFDEHTGKLKFELREYMAKRYYAQYTNEEGI